jgi:hypothetical protein
VQKEAFFTESSLLVYEVICFVSATCRVSCFVHFRLQAVTFPGIFFRGVQQIQVRTEGREIGGLAPVAPLVRGSA